MTSPGGAEYHDYQHYVGGQSHSNFASVFTCCDYIYGTDMIAGSGNGDPPNPAAFSFSGQMPPPQKRRRVPFNDDGHKRLTNCMILQFNPLEVLKFR
ncbi:hypothetical protein ACE6H2_017037 [Prunus campanulata]